MNRRMAQDLDNHITGHYGEDQFLGESEHIKVELDFIPVEERLPNDDMYDARVLCISPTHADPTMRIRVMAAQFVRISIDVTHWAEIPEVK